jgi:general secretion pathway protein A
VSFQPQVDTLTYELYFGLNEKPFSLNADPRFIYDSPTYVAARDSLLAGIRRREGLLVVTGEVGTGKSTLCRSVLRELGRKTYSSLVPDPFASREDLLKMLLIDFGVLSIQELTAGPLRGASRTELGYLLSEFIESLPPDAFIVVLIDEAQNLSLPLIEETRILSDTFGAKGRLQIVFVGQPELDAKLKLRSRAADCV